ncbi:MAG: hypothetical protein EPN98_21800 [Phenylobacterium sp.]|uniref:XF1762 family protein n=1 Tax=Phenylobacterium sp. TaxID=1871053 RepID=UPI0011FE316F|nr:XF1762 family protein [Phenylobacterium sp.]TAL29077.1 MAG: hypothetical protein EPN98_21800 [Phenylobacterium sp.]
MSLVLRPWTLKQALPFNFDTHRRLRAIQGALWSVRVDKDGVPVGVAIVANPARVWQSLVLVVARCAVKEGVPNACSMLYGSCARAGQAMGAEDVVTYTHGDEHGASLIAAGYVYAGLTDGGEWDRADRPRQAAIDPEKKHRWFAPFGKRAAEARALQRAGKLATRPPTYRRVA